MPARSCTRPTVPLATSATAKGDGSRFPPVAATRWVSGNPSRLIGIVLNGLQGESAGRRQTFNGVMPPHGS